MWNSNFDLTPLRNQVKPWRKQILFTVQQKCSMKCNIICNIRLKEMLEKKILSTEMKKKEM